MAIKNIKGVVVDVVKKQIYVKEITYDDVKSDYLNEYYKVLNCSCFGIVKRKIGKYALDIYHDDEGLLKDEKKPAIITFRLGKIVEVIYGNVFIVSHKDSETISLTDEEIKEVFKCCKVAFYGSEAHKVVVASV